VCLAIPGKLMAKSEEDGMLCGRVEFGGIVRPACLDFLPEAEVGEYVLVHVGFAISRIDEEEAKATLAYLEQLGMLQAELGAPEKGRP
jgi:hydrogenase expression/formation protein HypC